MSLQLLSSTEYPKIRSPSRLCCLHEPPWHPNQALLYWLDALMGDEPLINQSRLIKVLGIKYNHILYFLDLIIIRRAPFDISFFIQSCQSDTFQCQKDKIVHMKPNIFNKWYKGHESLFVLNCVSTEKSRFGHSEGGGRCQNTWKWFNGVYNKRTVQ